MADYARPGHLKDALALAAGGRATLLAGGTDFYPARGERPIDEDVLDLTAVEGLRGICEHEDHWRLGALTTWTGLIETPLPPLFDGYKQAAREVGGVQIQNAGTLAGNLCNASPAADGTPNLLALDARVELSSMAGIRLGPVAEFVTGSRKTARHPGEIVTALIVPKPRAEARSSFVKLGARRYLVISIVLVAVVLEAERGRVARARIAVGSCGAVPQRLPALERDLVGRAADGGLPDHVRPRHLSLLAPIDDVRGSAAYRRDAAVALVRRALLQAVEPPKT